GWRDSSEVRGIRCNRIVRVGDSKEDVVINKHHHVCVAGIRIAAGPVLAEVPRVGIWGRSSRHSAVEGYRYRERVAGPNELAIIGRGGRKRGIPAGWGKSSVFRLGTFPRSDEETCRESDQGNQQETNERLWTQCHPRVI